MFEQTRIGGGRAGSIPPRVGSNQERRPERPSRSAPRSDLVSFDHRDDSFIGQLCTLPCPGDPSPSDRRADERGLAGEEDFARSRPQGLSIPMGKTETLIPKLFFRAVDVKVFSRK